MPPKLPKPVPWSSATEFRQVYEWFYPPVAEDGSVDIRAQECAVRRVKAWATRGKLPIGVASTLSFTETRLRDLTHVCSDQELRTLYSMVLIRFVNGHADKYQTGKNARSIASIAVQDLGMPMWFVELRHTATHDYLPSLTILRSATQQALNWMHSTFWVPQLDALMVDEDPSEERIQAMTNQIRSVLEQHRDHCRQQLEHNFQKPDSSELKKFVTTDLLKRCGSGDDLLDILIPILLERGMLIPVQTRKRRQADRAGDKAPADDLNLVGNESPDRNMVEQYWIPLLVQVNDTLKNYSSVKTGEVFMFWEELVDALLDELVGVSSPPSIPGASGVAGPKSEEKGFRSSNYLKTIVAWIKHLLSLHYNPTTSIKGKSSIALQAAQLHANYMTSQRPNLHIPSIVETCLKNVNVYTRLVLNTIINHDANIRARITGHLRTIDQHLSGNTSGSTTPTLTTMTSPNTTTSAVKNIMLAKVEDSAMSVSSSVVPEPAATSTELVSTTTSPSASAISSPPSNSLTSATTSKSSWKVYDKDSWRPCPMGCLPGGVLPDLSLPWSSDAPPTIRFLV